MKKIFVILLFLYVSSFGKEKIYVIERESSSVAVIEECKLLNRIENLHNLNHAVIKFFNDDGYLITRDGFLIKFDTKSDKVIKELKVGDSSIGFVVGEDYIAVANYSEKSVIITDKNLNIIQKFYTGSKNVGIKEYKDLIVFSLMDNDEIWVLKRNKDKFEKYKVFKDVGQVPFDAMIDGPNYIVGFFNSPFIGVLNLENFIYERIKLQNEFKEPVLKVPHFGMWTITNREIIIPAIGNKKVYIFDKNFNPIKTLETFGLPVFTSISPDKKYLAVTFSGDSFPYLQIFNLQNYNQEKIFKFNGKVLHVRWSDENPYLYVSANDSNELTVLERNSWSKKCTVEVIKPSGIFIKKE